MIDNSRTILSVDSSLDYYYIYYSCPSFLFIVLSSLSFGSVDPEPKREKERTRPQLNPFLLFQFFRSFEGTLRVVVLSSSFIHSHRFPLFWDPVWIGSESALNRIGEGEQFPKVIVVISIHRLLATVVD